MYLPNKSQYLNGTGIQSHHIAANSFSGSGERKRTLPDEFGAPSARAVSELALVCDDT